MGKVDVSMLNMQATQAIHAGQWLKAGGLVGQARKLNPEDPAAKALADFIMDKLAKVAPEIFNPTLSP